LLKSQSFSYV